MPELGDLSSKVFQGANNPINMIRDLQTRQADLAASEALINALDDATADLGDQVQGRFIAPADSATSTEPTDSGFTGTFISGRGETFGAGTYHIGGVNLGVLKWGGNSSNGSFYFAGGAGIINEAGLYLTGLLFPVDFNATANGITADMWMGMTNTDPNGPDFRMFYQQPPPGSEKVVNGDAETAGTSDWAAVSSSTLANSTTTPYAGSNSFSASLAGTGTTPVTKHPEAKSNARFTVTAGLNYTVAGAMRLSYLQTAAGHKVGQTGTGYLYIKFYDASSGGTLKGTTTIASLVSYNFGDAPTGVEVYSSWQYQSLTVTAPAGATYAEIDVYSTFTFTSDPNETLETGRIWWDAVSVKQAGVYMAIQFSQDGLIDITAPIRLTQQTAPAAPATGYSSLFSDTVSKGLVILDENGGHRAAGEAGWTAYAFPYGWSLNNAMGSSLNLAANGGSLACMVVLNGPMMLRKVNVYNNNTSVARTWNWGLYVQDTNTENSSENTLRRVAVGTAAETFTPGAASERSIAASGAPVYLAAGVYWLVIQNQHASNTFSQAVSGFSPSVAADITQTKTTTNPNGATLDFVAATWTKASGNTPQAYLVGEVFGQNTAW